MRTIQILNALQDLSEDVSEENQKVIRNTQRHIQKLLQSVFEAIDLLPIRSSNDPRVLDSHKALMKIVDHGLPWSHLDEDEWSEWTNIVRQSSNREKQQWIYWKIKQYEEEAWSPKHAKRAASYYKWQSSRGEREHAALDREYDRRVAREG